MNNQIDTIIAFLDLHLQKTGEVSINPVHANKLLAKAGLLMDNKSRPGKPLRDLLRNGKIPHAFQLGSRGTSWIIPHSRKKTIEKSTITKAQQSSKKRIDKVYLHDHTERSVFDFESALFAESNFKQVSIIDSLVPKSPGLYCLRIKEIKNLPEVFCNVLNERQHNILYIGIASKSLRKRFLSQELRAKGHGTFFRSIGAMLEYLPVKGSLADKANKMNFKFSASDELKIIAWINSNLIANWVEYNKNLDTIETELIVAYKPLVNIAKNPVALELISALRKRCVAKANEKLH